MQVVAQPLDSACQFPPRGDWLRIELTEAVQLHRLLSGGAHAFQAFSCRASSVRGPHAVVINECIPHDAPRSNCSCVSTTDRSIGPQTTEKHRYRSEE
jgi:hypothetical protein